ncbi:MAG: MerR family transcriptional regulator [Brotaphodocola sp.]
MMTKNRYLIGDVANLMGLSRDTLRYYEKRGILTSEKGENGYRYYTERDISKMICILYQRKMDIGLSDMEQLWTGDGTLEKLSEITSARIEEERQALRKHEQTIARLQVTQKDCENFLHHLNQVTLQNFPDAYVVVPHSSLQESVELWFDYAKEYDGLDMMYFFDEYSWEKRGETFCTEFRNCQLILHRHLKEMVDYPIPEHSIAVTNPALCVSTYCISKERTPSADAIELMVSWAEKQGLMVSRQIYSTFAFQGTQNGEKVYYLQIYLPVF